MAKWGGSSFLYLIEQGHTVLATDVVPLLPEIRERGREDQHWQMDLQTHLTAEIWRLWMRPSKLHNLPLTASSTMERYPNLSATTSESYTTTMSLGANNILEACASHGINRVVQASSVNCARFRILSSGSYHARSAADRRGLSNATGEWELPRSRKT